MTRLMCGLFLSFLLLQTSVTVYGQVDTAALSRKLEQLKSSFGKHFAFALYKDGKIAYKKEVGDYNIKTVQYVNASSQWLTAAVTLIMAQEGKIGLDDKVSKYLPIFSRYGKGYITIRHCLTHNTGVDAGKFMEKSKFKTLEEEVDHYASSREIKTNPGTEFFYSNIGFKIVARVLEMVSKRPFDRLIKEKLTSPCAMRNTTFSNDNYNDAPDPAEGGRSTAFDYASFLGMLLNKGTFNNKQVMSPESVQILLSLQYESDKIRNAPKETTGCDYAFGSWILDRNSKGEPTVFICPSLTGTYTLLDVCRGYGFVLIPKENTGDVKKDVYQQIKSLIDESYGNQCQ